eukprot:scaffold30_cov416-Prasinococcus_capsulatus_cf.AAC.11
MALACSPSGIPEYQCQLALIGEQYQLYYAVQEVQQGDTMEVTLSFRVEVQNEGWIGLGFSPLGIMFGSTAVIASSSLEPQVWQRSSLQHSSTLRQSSATLVLWCILGHVE